MSDDIQFSQPACYTFEAYVPSYVAEDGTPMMHSVRNQITSREVTLASLLEAFENFLRASGYAAQLEGNHIIICNRGD